MYHELEDKLVSTFAETPQSSSAVPMNGGNAVAFEVTVFDIAAASELIITLQESNDLENWDDVSGAMLVITAVGYSDKAILNIVASQYVRLKLEI